MEIKYGTSAVELSIDDCPNVRVAIPPTCRSTITGIPNRLFEDLSRLVAAKNPTRAAIVVEDNTRRNPEHPALIRQIRTIFASAHTSEVSLVIAYGSHLRMTDEQAENIYGRDNLAAVTLVHHDCRSEQDLVQAGPLSDGTVFKMNATVARADFVLCIGTVMPHLFAGFTGGRKIILPGICSYENMRNNHTMVLDPRANLGIIENNPLHEQMHEAASLVPVDFSVQFCRGGNGELAAVHWGSLAASFEQAVETCRELSTISVPRRYDVVVIGCGGTPRDDSIYQAQRPFSIASGLVTSSGTAFIIGAFPNGFGNRLFEQWFNDTAARESLKTIQPRQIEIGVHSAYLLYRSIAGKTMCLFSSLPKHMITTIGLSPIESIDVIVKKCRNSKEVCVVPDASRIIVRVADQDKK